MNKIFLFKLAFKNLWSRKLRTVLTVMGITISVGFITFLISLGTGLQRVSTQEIVNLEALKILDVLPGNTKLLEITDDILPKFENLGNVELSSPHFQVASKINIDGSSIDGITYGKKKESIDLEDLKIVNGNKGLEKNDLLITSSALTKLGIKDPSKILDKEVKILLVPKVSSVLDPKRIIKKEFTYKITGVIENNESSFVYMNIDNLKELGFIKYDGLKLKVASKNDVETVKKKIESMGYRAASIKDTVDQINQFFSFFQIILISFGIIAVLVACLGMFNTLTINLLEKTREVGFMRVLGTSRKDIYRLFLIESLILGFLGGLSGIIISSVIGNSLNLTIASLAQKTGNKAIELFYLPPVFLIIIVIIVLLISLITGLWPSIRASRINPLNALKFE